MRLRSGPCGAGALLLLSMAAVPAFAAPCNIIPYVTAPDGQRLGVNIEKQDGTPTVTRLFWKGQDKWTSGEPWLSAEYAPNDLGKPIQLQAGVPRDLVPAAYTGAETTITIDGKVVWRTAYVGGPDPKGPGHYHGYVVASNGRWGPMTNLLLLDAIGAGRSATVSVLDGKRRELLSRAFPLPTRATLGAMVEEARKQAEPNLSSLVECGGGPPIMAAPSK